MTNTSRLILIVFALPLFAFSQDMILKCGNTDVKCNNGNKEHFSMVLHCPYEETDTSKLPRIVLDRARIYLTARVGQAFYQQLNYYQCQMVDFTKFDEIKKKKGWISENSDKRVKYAIQYYFIIQDNLRYYLTLVFDKDGNIISKDQLPNVSNNKQFYKILSICDAKTIAERDSIFTGEIQTISLEYLNNENAFIWKIEKPSIKVNSKNKNIHRFLLVNANSGQVIKRETELRGAASVHQAF